MREGGLPATPGYSSKARHPGVAKEKPLGGTRKATLPFLCARWRERKRIKFFKELDSGSTAN